MQLWLTAGDAARALRIPIRRLLETGIARIPGTHGSGEGATRPPRGGPRNQVRWLLWLRLLALVSLSTSSMTRLPLDAPGAGAAPLSQAAQAQAAQAQRTVPLSYGFQGEFFHTQSRPLAIAALNEAGIGWAKQQVRWEDYEVQASNCAAPTACMEESLDGRRKYFRRDRVGFLDAVIDDLSAAGLRVLLSVVRAPPFYAAPGGHAPADPDHLRDFVSFLSRRYAGKVQAIEPWNEQNLSWEWGGTRLWPNAPSAPPQGAVEFVALQRAAYQGIKSADASITVVLPALTPTGLGECWLDPQTRAHGGCIEQVQTAIDDRLYLEFLYQVRGGEIKNYYDVMGVHPSGYNNPPDDWLDRTTVDSASFKGHGSFYIRRYQQLREVQLKHGDTKPMWFTEVGWSVAPRPAPGYEYARDNTERTRGAYVGRLLEQVHAQAPYVTNVFLWNLNFRTLVPETDEKFGFGLVNPDWSRTPGYVCAADFVRSGNRITRPECRVGTAPATEPAAATAPQEAAPTETAPAATVTPPPSPTATVTTAPTEPATATVTPTSTATQTSTLTATPTPPATATPTSTTAAVSGAAQTAPASATAVTVGTVTPAGSASPSASATTTPTATPHAATGTLTVPTAAPTAATSTGAAASAAVRAAASGSSSSASAVDRTGTAALGVVEPAQAPLANEPRVAPSTGPRREHTVVSGDTLFSIARRTSTTVDALVAANGLGTRDAVLPIGRTLVVPAPTAAPRPPSVPTMAPLPNGRSERSEHTVMKGDTLYSIARRHGTTVNALVAANGLGSPDAVLRIGRTLVIPS